MQRRFFLRLGIAAASLAAIRSRAQGKYPERAVRLVVPFPPGGDTDVAARLWARYTAPLLFPGGNGSVVVENRAGAGGAIGAAEVARAPADGYTLLLGTTGTQIVSPAVAENPPYDPLRDFALVGIVSMLPTCIVVGPALGVSALGALVRLIKANPGKYSYGSAGPGTLSNLAGELFKHQAGGLDMPHVPYKGGGPAMQDLIGGHIPVIMPVFSSGVLAQHRAGRALIVGINSEARLKAAPDIPTSAEGGMPEMQAQVFDAIFAPAGTDAAALGVLRAASARALRDPALLQDLAKTGAEPFARADAEGYIREEAARWTAVIKAIGFRT